MIALDKISFYLIDCDIPLKALPVVTLGEAIALEYL